MSPLFSVSADKMPRVVHIKIELGTLEDEMPFIVVSGLTTSTPKLQKYAECSQKIC